MNKKGFTLIEILVVCTIIAILVILAVPNVQRSISSSRSSAFVKDARTVVSAAKSDALSMKATPADDYGDVVVYDLNSINDVLDKKLDDSPFGAKYKTAAVMIKKTVDTTGASKYTRYICMVDEDGNGFDFTEASKINANTIKHNVKNVTCDSDYSLHHVTVVITGGTVPFNSQDVLDGDTAEFAISVMNGYDSDEVTVNCDNDQTATISNMRLTTGAITHDTTCTINFKKNNYYTVSVVPRNGVVSGATSKTVVEKGTASFVVDPHSEYLYGSTNCSNGQTARYSNSILTTGELTNNTTCTVNFIPKTYSIAYNLNGGSVSPANPTSYTIETNTFTLHNPVKTGYTFTGWTGSNGSVVSTTVTITKGSVGDKNYTANWSANPLIFNNQSISKTYSTSSQTASVIGASNGTGTYTYSEVSEKNSTGTATNYISLSGTTITIAASTPSNIYTYVIKASDNNSKATKEATYTITVNKAANPISVTTPQTWGPTYSTSLQNKTFTAATNAQGAVTYAVQSQKQGSTAVSYFSIPTASTNSIRMAASTPVGTYTVVIRATAAGNSNYNSGYKDITMTITVAKANATITCNDKTYTGSEQTACSCSGGTIGGTYKATNAGSYIASCSPDSNHNAPTNVNWTMNKVGAKLTCSNKTYTGSEQTACSCSGGTVAGTYKATNAGSYTASCSPDSNHNAPANVSWTMNKVGAKLTCSNKTYTGSEQTACSCSGGTVTGTYKATAAGTYTASCSPDSNHNAPTNISWTMAKANATCPTISDWTGNWNGEQHSINVSGGSGGTIQYKWNTTSDSWRNTIPTASIVGSWPVYVQVAGDSNHNTVDCGSRKLTINKVTITCPSAPADKAYTGNSISSGIACPSGSTVSGTTSASARGTYTQTCTADSNHQFASACNVNWKIRCIPGFSESTAVNDKVTYADREWTVVSKSGSDIYLAYNNVSGNGAYSAASSAVTTFLNDKTKSKNDLSLGCIENKGTANTTVNAPNYKYWMTSDSFYSNEEITRYTNSATIYGSGFGLKSTSEPDTLDHKIGTASMYTTVDADPSKKIIKGENKFSTNSKLKYFATTSSIDTSDSSCDGAKVGLNLCGGAYTSTVSTYNNSTKTRHWSHYGTKISFSKSSSYPNTAIGMTVQLYEFINLNTSSTSNEGGMISSNRLGSSVSPTTASQVTVSICGGPSGAASNDKHGKLVIVRYNNANVEKVTHDDATAWFRYANQATDAGEWNSDNTVKTWQYNQYSKRWWLEAASIIRDSNGDPLPGGTTASEEVKKLNSTETVTRYKHRYYMATSARCLDNVTTYNLKATNYTLYYRPYILVHTN